MSTQSFEESIAEYLELTKELIGEESLEHLPPGSPAPYDQSGPPYECPLRLDPTTIRNFALSIGDSNPLFTVPEYGRSTRYGCQLAPGPILAMVRYPSVHGAVRDLMSWLVEDYGFTPEDAYIHACVNPDFRINIYQMVKLGALEYTAGAEIPKSYLR